MRLRRQPAASAAPFVTFYSDQRLGFIVSHRMGTKHTSRGPRRRSSVSAVRDFPKGCGPSVGDPPTSSSPEPPSPNDVPEAEAVPRTQGADEAEATAAVDRSTHESYDIDRRRNLASPIRRFPVGCERDANPSNPNVKKGKNDVLGVNQPSQDGAPEKIVIVSALMAAPYCPWRNPSKVRPRKSARTKVSE